jgi:hypothetical protein
VRSEQLRIGHTARTGQVDRAFGADHGGAGLPRDVWHVDGVVEVRVRMQDEIRPRNVRVDRTLIAHEIIFGPENSSRIIRQGRRGVRSELTRNA